jgi:hypothetical protein
MLKFERKNTITLILVWLMCFTQYIVTKAQSDLKRENYLTVEPTFSFAKQNELSVSFGLSNHKFLDEYPAATWGPTLGVGTSFEKNKNLLIGKLGYAYYDFGYFGTRLNAQYYTDFKNSQITFRPEIGFSAMGWFSVLYRYNINLNTDDTFQVAGHMLSLSFNLSQYMLKQ